MHHMTRRIKTTTVPLLLFLLTGCTSLEVIQQGNLFRELCEAPDRAIVYQTVKAEGYLTASRSGSSCQDGWNPIFEYGYKFAECITAKVKSHTLPENVEIYHFTLERKGHSKCQSGINHFINYSRKNYKGNSPRYKETNLGNNYIEKHKEQLAGKCLVVEKLDKPKSRYMRLTQDIRILDGVRYFRDDLYRELKTHKAETKKGLILDYRVLYLDLVTSEVIAKQDNYSYFPWGLKRSHYRTVECIEKSKSILPNHVMKLNQ